MTTPQEKSSGAQPGPRRSSRRPSRWHRTTPVLICDWLKHRSDSASYYLLGTFQWDLASAERDLERALEIAPTPTIHRAFAELLSARRRHEEALAQVALASRDEPRAVANISARGLALFRARNYTQARAALAETLRLNPADDRVRVHLARTQAALGKRQQAIITLEGSDAANRDAYVQAWRARFRAAAPGAAQGRGSQMFRTLRRTLGATEARNPAAPYNLATLQLILGDRAGPPSLPSRRYASLPRP